DTPEFASNLVSQIPSALLLEFQGLEEGLEIALAEGLAAPPRDDFEEQGRAVLEGFGEELEEVALVIGIDEDAEVADALVVFAHRLVAVFGEHLVDAVPDDLVVAVGEAEEVDAAAPEFGDAGEFVVGAQGEVLDAGDHVVPLQVFLDLALLLA